MSEEPLIPENIYDDKERRHAFLVGWRAACVECARIARHHNADSTARKIDLLINAKPSRPLSSERKSKSDSKEAR